MNRHTAQTAVARPHEADIAGPRQEITTIHTAAVRALGIKRLKGPESVRAQAEYLARSTGTELDVAVLAPHDAGGCLASGLLDSSLAAAGIRARVLYHANARNDAAAISQAARLADAGFQARTTPDLPPVLVISDQHAALIALDPAHPADSALCTREPVIVTLAAALFHSAWEAARPLHAPADGPDISAQEHALLRYLATGLTVETTARRLGISPRTAGRLVATLMDKLGASSRLQAGYEATRRGWL